MQKSRFTDERITDALRRADAGESVTTICERWESAGMRFIFGAGRISGRGLCVDACVS
jgi:hypothetical protein